MKWADLSFWASDHLALMMGGTLALFTIEVVRRRQQGHKRAKKVLQEAVSKDLAEPFSLHPLIDPNRCAGCGACVRACPEGEILQLINHRAAMVSPTKCVGHGECEAACPFDAITLVFGTKKRGKELPRISGHYETNIPGLYIAGELGGMGLIRNAVRQGKMAVEHAVAQLKESAVKADFDILVIGAGPAGLTAALAAQEAKVRYLCIEQDKFGGTIANFPRQKIIMSQPAVLPIVGPMRFPRHKVSKEELMERWTQIRESVKLNLREHTKFETLSKDGDLFRVKVTGGEITARKVILALGVRGTPRKLGIPGEALPKVTYNLIEPEQYQGRAIAVVGSGNAAAEAVDMLCKSSLRNKVTMLIATAGFDRCNEENEAKVRAAAQSGLVDLRLMTKVEEVHSDHLVINQDGQQATLKNDYLFIFIGAVMQTKFFTDLGITIDKKFGEPAPKGRSTP